MPKSDLYNEKFRRPNIAFTEILKKGAGGAFRERGDYSAFMFRALVIATDVEGGKLETPTGVPHLKGAKDWEPGGPVLHQRVIGPDGKTLIAEYDITPTRGPVNPANSLRARVVGNNMDQFISDDELRCYWPMFPGFDNPSAGELVYVVFEDEDFTHGLWMSRVPTNNSNQTSNQVLLSETVLAIQEGRMGVFNDAESNAVGTRTTGAPIKDPQRLTNLFLK